MSEKLRVLGWVGWEYDDGIQSVHVQEATEYHETTRRVPADLLAAYEAAELAAKQAGERLLAAWAAAPELPNPEHKS